MNLAPKLALSSLALLLPALSASAALLTLSPVADATIYGENTDNANGRGSGILAGNNANSTSATRRALLRFDFSSLPADSVVSAVTLRLFCIQENTGLASIPFTLHRLSSGWTEGPATPNGFGGQGTSAAPGDTTWLSTSLPGNPWSTPGGDFAPLASAATPVGPEGVAYTWSDPGLIADVQSWLDQSSSNFGWILRSDESITRTAKVFASREATNLSQRPSLEITYTVIPEPTALALLAPLALAAARRPRR